MTTTQHHDAQPAARRPRELTPEEVAWLRGEDVAAFRAPAEGTDPLPTGDGSGGDADWRTGSGHSSDRGRRRLSRRALVLGGLGVGAMAGTAWAFGGSSSPAAGGPAAGDATVPGQPGTDNEPHASCVAQSSLLSTGSVGSAKLVYELDQTARPMSFDAGFHRQLDAWLADWNATSRHGGVQQVWSYGAWVAKDECHSWHANGRAFDISRLRAGDEVLVSCRSDLWGSLDADRRRELERRYWALAASLHLHFAYVLTYHFDDLHKNHIHVDNGISGGGMSRFDPASRVQNQAVQAICATLWDRPGDVTGTWVDAQRQVAPVLDRLGVADLTRQKTWQAFLRASVKRG